MLNDLYIKLIIYIKDKFFNKALQKVISENRSADNWDKVDLPYCLSKYSQTLAVINNIDSVQTIEVYERELFKFISVGSIIVDKGNCRHSNRIRSISINGGGDHIALLRGGIYPEVFLFSLVNGKWKHKKTFKTCVEGRNNIVISLEDIRCIDFGVDTSTRKPILSFSTQRSVIIVHDYYKSSAKNLVAKVYY